MSSLYPTPKNRRRTPTAPRPELSEEQRQEVKEAFEIFDDDKDGELAPHQFKMAMRALGFNYKHGEFVKILRDLDRSGSHRVTYDDFVRSMTERILARDPLDEVRRAFRLFDDDETGKISIRNLRRVAKELQENLDEEELRVMIEEFDLDQDGEISEAEFIAIMMDEL